MNPSEQMPSQRATPGDLFSDVNSVPPQEMAKQVSFSEAQESAYNAQARGQSARAVAYWQAVMWEAERPELRRARGVLRQLLSKLREQCAQNVTDSELERCLSRTVMAVKLTFWAKLLREVGELTDASLSSEHLPRADVQAEVMGESGAAHLFPAGRLVVAHILKEAAEGVELSVNGTRYRVDTDTYLSSFRGVPQ